MPITIRCPSCGKTLQAPDNAVGMKVRCGNCQTLLTVEAPAGPPPARASGPLAARPVRKADDEDRPARPRRPADEEDERPARPRRRADGDEEDRPAPARRRGKDEDEEQPAPARRRAADAEDEEDTGRPPRGGRRPAAKKKKTLWVVLGCLGLAFAGCLGAVGVVGYLAYQKGSQSFSNRVVGTWVVDPEPTGQFSDTKWFFLRFAKDGTGDYGHPNEAGKYKSKWQVHGETPEGTEVWFVNADNEKDVKYMLKIKVLDDDHIQVTQPAYVGNCRMKRVAELPKVPERALPGPNTGRPADGKPSAAPGPLILDAHDSSITSVSYSADGATLVTAGDDGKVKLWEAASGRLKKELPRHPASAYGAVLLPDNKTVVSVGGKGGFGPGEVLFRDAATGRETRPARKLDSVVGALAASADGRQLAWPEHPNVVVWDVDRGAVRATVSGGLAGADPSLAFSRDGRYLLGVSALDVTYWDVRGKNKNPVPVRVNNPTCGAVTPDNTLVIGTEDRRVVFWKAGAETGSISGLPGKVRGVAVSADGRHLAVAAEQSVRLYDLGSKQLLATLAPPAGKRHYPRRLAFSPDGTRLASGSEELTAGKVYVWDVAAALKK